VLKALGFLRSVILVAIALKIARKRKKMTQAELAEATGVDRRQISAYETGRVIPQLSTIVRLASVLGDAIHERYSFIDTNGNKSEFIVMFSSEFVSNGFKTTIMQTADGKTIVSRKKEITK
jgi:transcriptional regulator with XRE-family HTH domain